MKKTTDIGIDIGTSKTVIFSSSKVVLELPSVVTVENDSWNPVFYGEKAKQTMGRTPESLTCVSPIKRGVIADYDLAEAMLSRYMEKAFSNKVVRPRIMATLPPGLTELQHHSLANVVEAAGGRNVSVIEPVFVKSKATIIDILTGSTMKLASVKEGSKITAFGIRTGGIFEATTINVSN